MTTRQTYTLGDVTAAMTAVLRETFDRVEGMYLDRGTSMFETLATVSAAEASQPVAPDASNIAAQVNHTTYYIATISEYLRGHRPEGVDWGASWLVGNVDDARWTELVAALRTAYDDVLMLMADPSAWQDDEPLEGGIALVAHCAYHLGEIRRSLTFVQR